MTKLSTVGPHSWVVSKTLPDIINLQRKLQPYFSWVGGLELPAVNKTIFGKLSVDKNEDAGNAKIIIQRFMEALLQDEIVSNSEILYNFFSPSPEHFKSTPDEEKENKLKKLTSLFKNNQNKKEKDDVAIDESTLMDEYSEKSMDVKDCIAEPFYALISEIFDLKGVFKWFRKSLVTFVQLSWGRTISRQLQAELQRRIFEDFGGGPLILDP